MSTVALTMETVKNASSVVLNFQLGKCLLAGPSPSDALALVVGHKWIVQESVNEGRAASVLIRSEN